MKTIKEILYEHFLHDEKDLVSHTTEELAELFDFQRSNVSRSLNQLVREGKLEKQTGRPVRYQLFRKTDPYFSDMIGSDKSLSNLIEELKSILLYPDIGKPITIEGESGVGMTLLLDKMCQFLSDNQFKHFHKLNCIYYQSDKATFTNRITSFLSRESYKRKSVVIIENVDLLSAESREYLYENLLNDLLNKKTRVILTRDRRSGFQDKGFVLTIPNLNERTLEERLAFIQRFLQEESKLLQKEIVLKSELFQSLLLYPCPNNVTQLKQDIQLAVAKANLRKANSLSLRFSDFPTSVNEGSLQLLHNTTRVENLIQSGYLYRISTSGIEKEKSVVRDLSPFKEPMNTLISQRLEDLKESGLTSEVVDQLLLDEVKLRIHQLQTEAVVESGSLAKKVANLTDTAIPDYAKGFLKEASKRFNRVYSEASYDSLCLHLDDIIQKGHFRQRFTAEQIREVMELHKEEYVFVTNFIAIVERNFSISIPIEEIIFLTLFIVGSYDPKNEKEHPSIVIAMHGKGVASSLAKVTRELSRNPMVYSFELEISQPMKEAYQAFSSLLLKLQNPNGILVIYDMGSMKIMVDIFMKQTNISISLLEMPYTVALLSAAQKALVLPKAEAIVNEVVESFQKYYATTSDMYQRNLLPKIIITLCQSGRGAALQMKQYIEEHANLQETSVVPLAVSQKQQLMAEINRLRQNYSVQLIVGTYHPKTVGIPFLSITKLFETPIEKLDLLLSLDDEERLELLDKGIGYSDIIDSVAEQLKYSNVSMLHQAIPIAMRRLKKIGKKLSMDEEMGLCLHLISLVEHHLSGNPSRENIGSDKILDEYPKIIKAIRQAIEDLEIDFSIEIDDREVARLVEMLK